MGRRWPLVSIMWANNETGVLFDVAAVGALCRKHGVPLHVDGVQAVGKIAFAIAARCRWICLV